MTTEVCLTVDVEDWYDGMAVLGEALPRPPGARSGLTALCDLLGSVNGTPAVTLFVVGNYAASVRPELEGLLAHGHEIASHGPDHGRMPEDRDALVEWLRTGREMIEEVVQRPVQGFRSPRFDIPEGVGLGGYREVLAEAGFHYVSDTSRLGRESPVREIPVLTTHGFPIGGGSYQRLLPTGAVDAALRSADSPAVLYYHSYDFGATLPSTRSIRSLAVARQLVGRGRIAGMFSRILNRYGSRACGHVER
jgi:peptidoglycan/xylan/chitin deacetylase (PgdA/CDA1 family)